MQRQPPSPHSSSSRPAQVTATQAGLFLLVFCVTGWGALGLPDHGLITWFTDDAFYYFNIARHVARGDGFTFDGIHATNGFHPLWLLLLVPVFRVLDGGFEALRGVLLLQSILLASAVALTFRVLAGRVGVGTAACVALGILGLPGSSALWLGMESGAALLLIVLLWQFWSKIEGVPTLEVSAAARLGALCALVAAARLEAALAFPLVLLLSHRRIRSASRPIATAAALCALPLVLGACYLLWNRAMFDTWLPVSGQVKSLWVDRLPLTARLLSVIDVPWAGRSLAERFYGRAMLPYGARALNGAVVAALLGLGWLFRRRVGPILRDAGAAFPLLLCAGIAVLDNLLVGPFLGEWALVPTILLTALVTGLLCTRVVPARYCTTVLLAFILLRVPAQLARAREWRDSFGGRTFILAEWIRGQAAPDDRIGTPYAGGVGYFSGRPVISLDGLVNDHAFFMNVLVPASWDAYFEATRLQWLVDVGCEGEAPLHNQLVGRRQDLEVAGCYRTAWLEQPRAVPPHCGLRALRADWSECGRRETR